MHPARSVIILTVATGAGYGLAVLMALLALFGALGGVTATHITGLTLALVLVAVGLTASTLHLGHPERAWRAMSQWRTSWLSREGLLAMMTFVPMGGWWLMWLAGMDSGPLVTLAQVLTIAGAGVTLFAQSMIYAQLKTVRAWSNQWTPACFAVFALMTGGWLFHALLRLGHDPVAPAGAFIALVATGMGLLIKIAYWRDVDGGASSSTPETATGLGRFGKVRLVEGPHTQANYLLREMGFQVARKHAATLRRIALGAGFAAPFLLTLLTIVVSGTGATVLAVLAAAAGTVGIITERWLFFAEAKHTVTLYYGADAA